MLSVHSNYALCLIYCVVHRTFFRIFTKQGSAHAFYRAGMYGINYVWDKLSNVAANFHTNALSVLNQNTVNH